MTDSRPPTGMQEQHPLSVYFDNNQNKEMQIQENEQQSKEQLSDASFGRSYEQMP